MDLFFLEILLVQPEFMSQFSKLLNSVIPVSYTHLDVYKRQIHTILNFMGLYERGVASFKRFMEVMELEPAVADLPGCLLYTSVVCPASLPK